MDPIQELKKTCDDIGRAFEEFKAENNRLIQQGVRDALAEAKLDKLNQAIDDLTGKKEDLEKRIKAEAELREELERKVNELRVSAPSSEEAKAELAAVAEFDLQVKAVAMSRGLPLPQVDRDTYRAYKSAFDRLLRKGEKGLGPEEYKALSVGSEADGGFLVPADTTGRIVRRLWELSPIRQICNVQTLSSDRLEGITDLGETDAGWVGETQTRSDTNTPQVGKYEIPVHEMYAQPKATQKLLDDASVDIEAWLAGKVANKFARLEADGFINGNGVNKPRGLFTYPTAATSDTTRPWGTFEHINTGGSGDFASSNPADVLFDVELALKAGYRTNARWLTRRSVIAKIRKFKGSDNNYLWQPGLQAGQPATLIGYPIVLAEEVPTLNSASLSLAFGDFNEGYQIVDRLGVRVLRDPYTDKPYVKFYTIKRTGGAAVNFEAIKFLRFSAS